MEMPLHAPIKRVVTGTPWVLAAKEASLIHKSGSFNIEKRLFSTIKSRFPYIRVSIRNKPAYFGCLLGCLPLIEQQT